jgi:N-acetylmuramoyl-L-alanine amidase
MSKFCWIIDNGHGRDTKGKRSPEWDNGKQLFEFQFNRKVVDLLLYMLDDTDIEYTELVPELKDVSLRKRTRRANKVAKRSDKPCIFVSVHGNAYSDQNVNGIETFHYPGSEDGFTVADIFQEHLIKRTGWNNRGVKEAKFAVLKHTRMPAILTENGFYTNYGECMKMLSETWQRKIAQAHFDAIREIEEDL